MSTLVNPAWVRLLLLLAVVVGLTGAPAPVARAADACGYQQTYGPYGAAVGAQTPELILALTTCTPDQTHTDTNLLLVHVVVDNRPRIDWGDGTGWHTGGIRSGDCAAALLCVLYGAPHTYSSPGTYKVRVQYYFLPGVTWYTSSEITLNVYDTAPRSTLDPANWMGAMRDQIRTLKLNALAIPGTHDSGAYGFTAKSLTAPDFPVDLSSSLRDWAKQAASDRSSCPGVISTVCSGILDSFATTARDLGGQYAAAKPGQNLSTALPKVADYIAAQSNAQGRDIRQQLNDGIRSLDLRLCAPVAPLTEVTLCHGLYSGAGMSQVLSQIHDFVVAHASEIVIVGLDDFHAVDGVDANPQKDALITQIRKLFSTNPADACQHPETCLLVASSFTSESTLDSIWKTPGRVILLDDAKVGASGRDANLYPTNPVFWDRSKAFGGEWIQTDDPKAYQDAVFADLGCRCETYNTTHGLKVTTTPSMLYGVGTAMSPSTDWVASTLVQRLLQKDPAIGSTLGAVLITAILNDQRRHDLVVDPTTSGGEVLRQRAKLSNALSLNGLYARALGDPGSLANVNVLNTDWYHESRLVDIAIALNQVRTRSVTLFSSVNAAGTPRTFVGDVPDLVRIGFNDQASSLRVTPGAVVSLFSDAFYQGTCQAFSADAVDLRGSTIGNDTVSSLRVDSRSLCGTPWLTLYQDGNLGGSSFTTTASMPNLNGTPIGNQQASSLIAGPGTTVSTYAQPNYTGTCQTFTAGVTPNLANTRVGNDTIWSVKLGEACPADVVSGDVALCANASSLPPCIYVHGDVPRFADTALGDNNVRYVGVPLNGTMALFSDENYQGMCLTFTAGEYTDLASLGMLGTASSMLVNRGCPVDDDTNGVVVYDGITFTGAHAAFTSDVADLTPSGLNGRVSSLAVSRGMVVTLYAGTNFQGTCMSFRANAADLRTTRFGNDAAASLRVGTSSCSG